MCLATSFLVGKTYLFRSAGSGVALVATEEPTATMAIGIDVKGPPPEGICGPCMKGRQQRKPSRNPMLRATKFLEEVHTDLGGPLPVSYSGMRYYISFKDDATGTYHVYPLKLKSDAYEKIKEHIRWVSQETGMQLKALHSDGGGEFKNDDLKDWMKEQHITWRPSAPYTPEQNGKAERLNYTLMSSVRSILLVDRRINRLKIIVLCTVLL